jgi:hypothetical protein
VHPVHLFVCLSVCVCVNWGLKEEKLFFCHLIVWNSPPKMFFFSSLPTYSTSKNEQITTKLWTTLYTHIPYHLHLTGLPPPHYNLAYVDHFGCARWGNSL